MILRTICFFTLIGMGLSGIIACSNNAKSAHSATDANTSHATQAPPAASAQTAEAQHAVTAAGPAPTIPDFTFYILRSGIQFTKNDLAKQGNIVFVLFDPTCSHCQHEANHLGTHYDEIKDAHIYFVSMNDPALMSTFLETHAKQLVGKANVELLYDRNADFINKFHIPSQFPAVYIYGNNGQLKEHWDGERDIAEVVAAIRK